MSYIPRLKTKYRKEVAPKLMEEFQYKSVMEVPRVVKVSVNQGLGDATGKSDMGSTLLLSLV